MPANANHTQPHTASSLFKTIAWRLMLTLFILFVLAGPGATLLQQIAGQ